MPSDWPVPRASASASRSSACRSTTGSTVWSKPGSPPAAPTPTRPTHAPSSPTTPGSTGSSASSCSIPRPRAGSSCRRRRRAPRPCSPRSSPAATARPRSERCCRDRPASRWFSANAVRLAVAGSAGILAGPQPQHIPDDTHQLVDFLVCQGLETLDRELSVAGCEAAGLLVARSEIGRKVFLLEDQENPEQHPLQPYLLC